MLRTRFTCDMPADRQHAQAWLRAADALPLDTRGAAPNDDRLRWLADVLALARALLQAARLPVFDDPIIESIAVDPARADTLATVLRFPAIERIAPSAHDIALTASASVLFQFAGRAPDAQARRAFFEALDREAFTRLAPLVPGGKGTVPVLRVAHALGIPFQHLGGGTYQLGWGSASRRLSRSVTQGDSALGARLSQSKWDTARLLSMAGLPAPHNGIVKTLAEAAMVAQRLDWPVVVKPADGERGEGVTVDVFDAAALARAYELALQSSHRREVLVERQADGVCHRLFVSHGRLLYAVKRLPMSVRADGARTVAQLVADAVEEDAALPPWQRSGIVPLDALARESLRHAGWSEDSIPPAGTWVALRRIESTAWGGIDEDVSRIVHPDNLDAATRAAAMLGLEVAGIDIITTDIAKPWHETGAVINEVNHSPLLGGGEISRSYLPEFMHRLMGDAMGSIPLAIFTTGEEEAAKAQWRSWQSQGLRAWLVDTESALGPHGSVRRLALRGMDQRLRALLLDGQVDAACAVMTPAEAAACSLLQRPAQPRGGRAAQTAPAPAA